MPSSACKKQNQDDARYGFRCCHLKNIWTAPLPLATELSRQFTTSTTSIYIMGLQAAYANLHTDQERDYIMQRYYYFNATFAAEIYTLSLHDALPISHTIGALIG